jgi:hypothetical protein
VRKTYVTSSEAQKTDFSELEALRAAIDDGDASPDAKGDIFARVRRKLKLEQRRG